ncbi:hypothetical protein GDO81_018861 [Engystomops pustulosus]|uniref:Uncharacterized protein n=1 Tax=Engystomops pustulosus TaxID=76066 RepID=A0AAV6YTM2_ENGPU|nr:hypothetical protein GDO81_018861 [Engystomops pustulosus]
MAALRKRLLSFISMCQSLLSYLHCSVREQAFKLLSDLLVIFNDRIGRGEHSYLHPLSCSPELLLQVELASFLADHVFNNAEDDGIDEGHKMQRLHERRILLAGYCKLILYNTLELRYASEVFRHYIKAYTGFTSEDDSPDRRFSQAFLNIRDLARRFSLLLGPDQIRNRQDVVLLHKEGIKFSLRPSPGAQFSPQNLLFLDVLSEFSPKLLKQDKAALLHYLEETCHQCIPPEEGFSAEDEGEDIWAPLRAYGKSLSADSAAPTPPGTRRARDRRQVHSPRHSPLMKKRRFSKEESSIVLTDEDNRQSPLMSSTVLRGRKTTPSPADDTGAGSDSDFDTSQSFSFRRPPRSAPKTQGETSSALGRSLHRLSLMEEEEDEDEEMVIEDRESTAASSAEEDVQPDLLDSAILDSEE